MRVTESLDNNTLSFFGHIAPLATSTRLSIGMYPSRGEQTKRRLAAAVLYDGKRPAAIAGAFPCYTVRKRRTDEVVARQM
jgi:hypothetical protein